MTQLLQPAENKSEPSACGKNHIKITAELGIIPLIPPLLGLAAGQPGMESNQIVFILLFLCTYLIILGVALWEAVDLISNKGLSSCCGRGRIAVATGLCLMPWSLPLTELALGPGFIVPFLHNLIIMAVLIATVLWEALGFILLVRTKAPMRSFLVILYFILPAGFILVFFPVIGPAGVTLLNAFNYTPKEKLP
jgi:hypothetical protein